MNFERFTHLSQQSLAQAQKLAEARKNPVVEAPHLLSVILEEGSSPVVDLLKAKKLLESARSVVSQQIASLPVVSGQTGGQGISHGLQRALQA